MEKVRNTRKSWKLKVGDIILIKKPSSNKKGTEEDLGLVYDLKEDQVQILCLATEKKRNHVKIGYGDFIEGDLARDYFVVADQFSLIKLDWVLRKEGRISVQKLDEIFRHVVYGIIEKYYDAVHKKDEDFTPRKTYIRCAGRVYDAEEMKILADSCLDFWLTAGRFAKRFEANFARFLRVKHCVLTNSGSSANLLAMSALTSSKLGERKLEAGDEVITTACAFPTTVNPIIQNNLIPVFLDVDIGTYNIQTDKIEAAITKKTKAIFLAHTLGNPFDIDDVLEICEKHDLWLIEDTCDALGSKYNGQYTGTFGHLSTFSFYPAHHITMGEGGALVTNDIRLKRILISFRDWGRDCWCETGHDNTCGKRFDWQLGALPFGYDHKYIYSHIGYNLKVTDMQAAVGVVQLEKLPRFLEARKRNWQILYEGLKKYEDYFILPERTNNSDPGWFGFALTVKENEAFTRNDIVTFLEDNEIATRMLFAGNIIRQPAYEGLKYNVPYPLENTDFIMNNTFWIGVYPGLTKERITFVLDKFQDFFAKTKFCKK
jgi:CDP-6-deoxy-D-xylo-4-hexulose-3-dehydrase